MEAPFLTRLTALADEASPRLPPNVVVPLLLESVNVAGVLLELPTAPAFASEATVCESPPKSSVAPAATDTGVVAGSTLKLATALLFMRVCTWLAVNGPLNIQTSSISPFIFAVPSPPSGELPIQIWFAPTASGLAIVEVTASALPST